MKKFISKKWLGIPVIAILAVVLAVGLVGGALAYNYLTVTMTMKVAEPMTVSMDYYNTGSYSPIGGTNVALTDSGVAGDTRTFWLKVHNSANNPITVDTTYSCSITGAITLTGLPNGSIPANSDWSGLVTATISAEAAPSDTGYVVAVTFSRH